MNKCVFNSSNKAPKITININKWIYAGFLETKNIIERNIKDYRFDEASRIIYQFVWHSYCDWYIEFYKYEYNEENKKNLDATMHGFIAQEVKAAMDKAGNTTFTGWKIDETDGVTQRTSREMFVMPLIRAVQELSAEVKELKAKLEDK